MGLEIERKYLLTPDKLPPLLEGCDLEQGYLASDPWVRIRLSNNPLDRCREAFITIKSIGTLVRSEFEYGIPVKDGEELLALCKGCLSKTRYHVRGLSLSHVWEVDRFHGALEGLWLAEVELRQPDEEIILPAWVGEEVTEDYRYSNAYLAEHGIPDGVRTSA